MNANEIAESIDKAVNEYTKKHGQAPVMIKLRRDVNDLLHTSRHAFLFDFVDLILTRERFMGMDVNIVEGGERPFEIEEGRDE